MLHIVNGFVSNNLSIKKNKEETFMNKVEREDIPYFLTKEYGDKQRRKQKLQHIRK